MSFKKVEQLTKKRISSEVKVASQKNNKLSLSAQNAT